MRKVRTNYPLEINDYNYDLLKCFCHKEQRVAYNCTICGEHTEKFIFTLKSPQFLCRKHQIEATAKERYGSVERMQQMNLEHGRQTKKEKYGNENYVNLEKAKLTKKERYGDENYTNRERAKNTLRERYGVDNCSQVEGSRNKAKETWVTNYGVDNPMKDSEIKQKQIDTVNQKYGVENVSQLQSIKEKVVETNKERFGVDYPLQSKEIKQKMQHTCLDKYGVDNPMKLQSVKDKVVQTLIQNYGEDYDSVLREKAKQTCITRYGVDNPAKSEVIKDKIKQTTMERYGVDSVLKSDEVWAKIRHTFLLRYGTEHPQFKHTYKYDNELFDSSWEVAFYIYHKDLGDDIHRATTPIAYTHEGKQHFYYPDFIVNGELYEVKGDQFFKEDGTMQNPFNHELDALFEAKRQCGVNHNVHFVSDSEMVPVFGYIDYRYGDGYLGQFKTSE